MRPLRDDPILFAPSLHGTSVLPFFVLTHQAFQLEFLRIFDPPVYRLSEDVSVRKPSVRFNLRL